MNVIYVDDELNAIQYFKEKAQECPEITNINCFNTCSSAIEFVKINQVDIAFLDIEMIEMSGIELAKIIGNIDSNVNIVFITAYDNYAIDAFDVDASGYLLKPFTVVDINKVMERISKYKKVKPVKKIQIRTFGRFDVFVSDKLVAFTNSKAKELFALLVDSNGGMITMEHAMDWIWEGRDFDTKTKKAYREAIYQMRKTLSNYGIEDIVKTVRGSIYLEINDISCDYYELLKHNKNAIDKYDGEYMIEYSWAEETTAKIENFLKKNNYKIYY